MGMNSFMTTRFTRFHWKLNKSDNLKRQTMIITLKIYIMDTKNYYIYMVKFE